MPIRLELGKQDMLKQEVRAVRRDTGEKMQLKWDTLTQDIKKLLEEIQEDMYKKAVQTRNEHKKSVSTWEEFMEGLNQKNLCLAPWCNENQCEIAVKERSKEESLKVMQEAGEEEEVLTGAAKTLCIPFDQEAIEEGTKCIGCGQDAKIRALWGRTY